MYNRDFLSRRATAWLLALLPFLYFLPATTGQVLLAPGDGWAQNYPLRILVGEMLARGEFPLWNPYIFGGMPLLATVYPGAAYPPNWLFALLPPGVAMNLVVITTYHIALIGCYRLGRTFGWQRNAALCLAITFSFSAFMLTHLGHTSRIAAAAWLPWVMLALEKLTHRITTRWIVRGVLFVGLQMLAGEPQMWLHTAMLGVAFITWKACYLRHWRLLFASLAMLVGGLLFSAAQWLPALELIRYGERAAMTYEFFSSFSFPPRQFAALWLPFFAGGASVGPYRMPYVYWGEWQANVTGGYVGMLAWLLAGVSLWRTPNSANNNSRRFVWFWFGVVIISLILALGDNLPGGLQRLLFYLPGYNVFRGPYRHLLEFAFALAVLAGYGWQRLTEAQLSQRRKLLARSSMLLTPIVLAASATYVWLTPYLFPKAGITRITDANVTIPLTCLAGSLIAAYWYWGITLNAPRWIGFALLVWMSIDLVFYGHFFYWRDSPYSMQSKTADTAITKLVKQRETAAHNYRILTQYRFSEQPDWSLDAELLNYPNISLLRDVHSLNGYDVLRLTRFEQLLEQDATGMVQADSIFSPSHRGLDLLNTKYVIYSNALPELSPKRWHKIDSFGPVSLYENQSALPRAWLVPEARNLASPDVLRVLRTGILPDGKAFDPRQTVLFSRREIPLLPPSTNVTEALAETTQIITYETQRISLTVIAVQPRWLVLSETDYPGWEAWLDGQQVPSYRANYLLRAVAIPAGSHQLEFRYRPRSFQVGILLTLITLVAVLLIQWLSWRKSETSRA